MARLTGKLKGWLSPGGGKHFVAVDFDSRELRIAECERVAGKTSILRLASEPIPEGIDAADPQGIGEFLGGTLKAMKIAAGGVVMSVPRGLCVLKPLTLPPGAAAGELPAMVQFQMEKELPFRPEEAVIDFTLQRHYGSEPAGGSDPQGVQVLVAAVRMPVVDFYRQIALSAGVRLQRLGLRPHANSRCADHCLIAGGTAEHVAVVHLTSDETEIDVLTSGALAFSRSTMGKIPPPGGDADESSLAVDAIVREAARSLQSYQSVEGGGRVSRIYIAGGTGAEAIVRERLGERMRVECLPLDPARAFGLDGQGNAAEFISALGLAVQHGDARALPFDFLHPKRPVVRRDLTRLRTGALVACGVLGVILAVVAGRNYVRAQQAAVKTLTAQLKDAQKAAAEVEKLASRVKAVEKWRKSRGDWLDHWAHLNALFPSATEAFMVARPGLKAHDTTMTFIVRARTSEPRLFTQHRG